MARHTTITDKQILEAARAIFLEEGFGVQTAKIAQRARVSEGTIFKRFPTKEALFYAALEIEQFPAWHAQVDKLTAEWGGREGLVSLFLSILLYFNDVLPRIITTIGSRVGALPRPFEGIAEDPRTRDRRILSRFFRQAMDAGYLRPGNAELLARLLLGTAIEASFDVITEKQQLTAQELRTIAEGTLDVLWNGIDPA